MTGRGKEVRGGIRRDTYSREPVSSKSHIPLTIVFSNILSIMYLLGPVLGIRVVAQNNASTILVDIHL